MSERKIVEINGISYTFHISSEQNGLFITGYIQLLNNHETFRELENPSLTIKRILYYHIFQKIDKYLIIKTSDIETDEEFKALYEIVDIEVIKNNKFNEIVKLENNEELNFELKIFNQFTECENYVSSPFGNTRNLFESNTEQIMDLFRTLVFYVKVNSSNHSRTTFTNEIDELIKKFIHNKFGDAFIPLETERITCNQNEVQIKYVIMPNGF
ncbi:TPA: hypothetical protein ACGZ96_003494 [Elizabethkingia anophelis]